MQPMRTTIAATVLGLTVIAAPARTSAQDIGDFAAYVALIYTPMGAFVPLPPPASVTGANSFNLRYGNLDFAESTVHSFAFGGDLAAGRGRLGLTLGGNTCDDDCDGAVMVGVDYTIPLTQSRALVALRPAFGFSKPLEGDGVAYAFGASLPLGIALSESTGPVFVPYIVPGLGFGRLSEDDDSESGMRPTLGGGLSIAGRQGSFAAHFGFNKVFIDEGQTSFGFGLSFGRRTAP
jgi:hypothetical protein